MAMICTFCQRSFHNQRGLNVHQKRCPKRSQVRLRLVPQAVQDDQATLQTSEAPTPVAICCDIIDYQTKLNPQTLMDDRADDGDIHLPLTELTIASGPLVLPSASDAS
jgi:hypothetical protein